MGKLHKCFYSGHNLNIERDPPINSQKQEIVFVNDQELTENSVVKYSQRHISTLILGRHQIVLQSLDLIRGVEDCWFLSDEHESSEKLPKLLYNSNFHPYHVVSNGRKHQSLSKGTRMFGTKYYPVALEVSGPFGMFADPMSGSESCSYPLPPISACMGMIASIVYRNTVDVSLVAVATCRFPRWTACTYNSFSPLRVEKTIKEGTGCQVRESILEDPCFQILALFSNKNGTTSPVNFAHAQQEQFFRRVSRGQCFKPVSLGRKECLSLDWGFLKTPVEQSYSTVLPCMVQETLHNSKIRIVSQNNVLIKNGVLKYETHPDIGVCIGDNGCLRFEDHSLQSQIDKFAPKSEVVQ